MAAAPPRIKLIFEGVLGQQLAEHRLQKCWYQMPDITVPFCQLRTVSDFTAKLCKALKLSSSSTLQLQMDGYSILSNSPLSLFRDGETITVTAQSELQIQTEPQDDVAITEKKRRSKSPLALTAPGHKQAQPEKVKRRKTAATTAANSSPTADAGPLLAEPAVASPTEQVVSRSLHTKAPKRKAGHATAAFSAEAHKEADHLASKMPRDAPRPAGDAPNAAALPQTALPPEETALAATQGTSTEEHTQSRNARRKQLKRKLKREGLLSPRKPSNSNGLPASVTAALAAAADASPFDPNALQPHQGQLPPHVTEPMTDSPPFNSHKPVRRSLKAQHTVKGHVHFVDSGSESDSDDEGSLPAAAALQNGHASTSQKATEVPESSSHPRSTLAQSHQAMGSDALRRGIAAADKKQQAHQACDKAQKPSKPNRSHAAQHSGAGPSTPQDNSGQGRAGPSMPQPDLDHLPLPKSDAEHAALPKVAGAPQLGDVVAYKLLEIGLDWAPQVSEWRHGKVEAVEADAVVIVPLPGQGSAEQPSVQANGHVQEEEAANEDEDEDEGPPSAYDDDGVLTTDLSALSELRLMQPSTHATAPSPDTASGKVTGVSAANTSEGSDAILEAADTETAAAQVVSVPHASKAVVHELASATTASAPAQVEAAIVTEAAASVAPEDGVVDAAQKAAASTGAVPNIGAWAQLQDQLAKRKAELAQQSSPAATQTSNVHDTDTSTSTHAQQQQQGLSNHGTGRAVVAGMHVPGAVRPRGGVRASAMGPMLAFLRSSGGLEQ